MILRTKRGIEVIIESGKFTAGSDLSDVHLTGLVDGDAYVSGGREAIISGTVAGSLRVGPGCTARVNGTVLGDLIAEGSVEVAGVIRGRILVQEGGRVNVISGAVIGGNPSH